jgi:DNA-directed RNA polymerase subunit E'/Rpb7
MTKSSPTCAINSLYHATRIRRKLCIPFSSITDFSCVEAHLTQVISNEMDGRCIAEGFVKPGSCFVRSYSNGTFAAGNIRFDLEIECMLCCPKEGTVMNCIAKTVTQAGIRAHAFDHLREPSPVVIYISREMHDASSATTTTRIIANHMSMDSIKPGDVIQVRVVGKRFDLNDKYVSIIGEWTTTTTTTNAAAMI